MKKLNIILSRVFTVRNILSIILAGIIGWIVRDILVSYHLGNESWLYGVLAGFLCFIKLVFNTVCDFYDIAPKPRIRLYFDKSGDLKIYTFISPSPSQGPSDLYARHYLGGVEGMDPPRPSRILKSSNISLMNYTPGDNSPGNSNSNNATTSNNMTESSTNSSRTDFNSDAIARANAELILAENRNKAIDILADCTDYPGTTPPTNVHNYYWKLEHMNKLSEKAVNMSREVWDQAFDIVNQGIKNRFNSYYETYNIKPNKNIAEIKASNLYGLRKDYLITREDWSKNSSLAKRTKLHSELNYVLWRAHFTNTYHTSKCTALDLEKYNSNISNLNQGLTEIKKKTAAIWRDVAASKHNMNSIVNNFMTEQDKARINEHNTNISNLRDRLLFDANINQAATKAEWIQKPEYKKISEAILKEQQKIKIIKDNTERYLNNKILK